MAESRPTVSHFLISVALLVLTWVIWVAFKPRKRVSLRSVVILVLGDIGRSPRMMYHAQSFAENDFTTNLIGYGGTFSSSLSIACRSIFQFSGSNPIPSLKRLPKIDISYLPEPPKLLRRFPFVIAAPIKIIHQIFSIFLVLLFRIEDPPEFILVQVHFILLVCAIQS
jgi:beta-1,4-mannosyltransferase